MVGLASKDAFGLAARDRFPEGAWHLFLSSSMRGDGSSIISYLASSRFFFSRRDGGGVIPLGIFQKSFPTHVVLRLLSSCAHGADCFIRVSYLSGSTSYSYTALKGSPIQGSRSRNFVCIMLSESSRTAPCSSSVSVQLQL